MHEIEPFFKWRDKYKAEEDKNSPFYRRDYSELYYSNQVYNFLLHPQWDDIGSNTLYVKILYCDYERQFCIIELIGEWNDCISNDIMFLKREVIDRLVAKGILHFLMIGENVLNFHFEGDDYYEEWFNDVEDGWVACINFRPHVVKEMVENNADMYLNIGGDLDDLPWRTFEPQTFFERVNRILTFRLNPPMT